MIFITLGSQKFQFNRLLKHIDTLISQGLLKDEVLAQIGNSDYIPQNYQFKNFFDREEFSEIIDCADLIITHGGTGAIINAVKKKKKVIALPRLSRYGEHVDDHQIQILEQFEEINLIYACYDCDDLCEAIEKIKYMKFSIYESNTKRIVNSIEKYINEL